MFWTQQRKRFFYILVLIWAAVLLASIPVTIAYSALSKPSNLDQIVSSLRTGKTNSPELTPTIQAAVVRWGYVRHAVPIGYQHEIRQGNVTWTQGIGVTTFAGQPARDYDITEASYLALFTTSRMPVILSIEQYTDSRKNVSYNIEVNSVAAVVVLLAISIAALVLALRMLRKNKRTIIKLPV